jgi:hypothetical protein
MHTELQDELVELAVRFHPLGDIEFAHFNKDDVRRDPIYESVIPTADNC